MGKQKQKKNIHGFRKILFLGFMLYYRLPVLGAQMEDFTLCGTKLRQFQLAFFIYLFYCFWFAFICNNCVHNFKLSPNIGVGAELLN